MICNVSKLLYVMSRAVRRVKFETILKYHKWYLCQISRTNHAITYTDITWHCVITVRSDDVKVLKSRWNLVKTKTTTPGNNTTLYWELLSLLLHLFHLSFKLYFSHTNSHITLGPTVNIHSKFALLQIILSTDSKVRTTLRDSIIHRVS